MIKSSKVDNYPKIKYVLLTFIALCALAANSVICRLALGSESIDAASFTSIRLIAGAIVLMLLVQCNKRKEESLTKGSWLGGVTLFVYAVTFSYAYMTLDTATGALILFGAVQLSIMLIAYFSGQKFRLLEWGGVAIAFGGLIYLVWPLLSQPRFFGAILMASAGVSWGIYTLIGRGSLNPLADTGYNFLRTLPFVSLLFLFTYSDFQVSTEGVVLAIVSGALTSGIGYAIWYLVLPNLTTSQAAALQLTVPIIAAIGGVVLVAEPMTLRLALSSFLVLGGIALVIFTKKSNQQPQLK